MVLPSYYAFSIILQMLTGGVYFHEFREFGTMQSWFRLWRFCYPFCVYQLSLRAVGIEERTTRAATMVLGDEKFALYRRHSLVNISTDISPKSLSRRFSYLPQAYNAFPSPAKSAQSVVPDGMLGGRKGSLSRQRTYSVAITGLGVA